MQTRYTSRLEASVTYSICTQLENLGWIVNEKSPDCNVFQQRAKTSEQKLKLNGKKPDFVLYKSNTDYPIAIIEAKRPGQSLSEAMDQAEKQYASLLNAPLILTYNDTYIETKHFFQGRPLKIDGEDVTQFFDHFTALRFINEGPEILSAPSDVQYSREELIKIFKNASDLLRKAGLQAGSERFGAFSDILFLKLMDEKCQLQEHAGMKSSLPKHMRWSHFKDMPSNDQHEYIKDVVWKYMNDQYGTIFGEKLPIDDHKILNQLIIGDDEKSGLSSLNLSGADSDVKGDAFEYFLKNAYQGLSIKDLGEYFTPRNIVRTMVSMVNPRFGERIYDPFCGTGGFLIETLKYIQLRVKLDKKSEKTLKQDTIYGSEITSNARIAKMNMILAGDGHSNINKWDSLANPQTNKFDVVITNVPFSQRTDYGDYYPIPSTNGDAICMEHCFDSLKPNGRGAILVKENFVSDGGDVGAVREYMMKNSKNFSVVSLPRKLFVPYTPTKTSIVYFEKNGRRDTTYFYVVNNVGHTLSARKRITKNNDLPKMLDAFNSEVVSKYIDSWIVDNARISKNNYSLWPYDYAELIPKTSFKTKLLSEIIKERVSVKNNPWENETSPIILGVSNKFGVFDNETEPNKQKYKKVFKNDLVYNPHRINVGSIGVVPEEFDGGYVSSIYVVFHSIDKKCPPEYLLNLLKSPQYLKVIEAYDTKFGAVRANLTFEMLSRIRIPYLDDKTLDSFMTNQKNVEEKLTEYNKSLDELKNNIFKISKEELKIKL